MRNSITPTPERLFEHSTANLALYHDYLSVLEDSSRIHEVLEVSNYVKVSREEVMRRSKLVLEDHLHQAAYDVILLGGWDIFKET